MADPNKDMKISFRREPLFTWWELPLQALNLAFAVLNIVVGGRFNVVIGGFILGILFDWVVRKYSQWIDGREFDRYIRELEKENK